MISRRLGVTGRALGLALGHRHVPQRFAVASEFAEAPGPIGLGHYVDEATFAGELRALEGQYFMIVEDDYRSARKPAGPVSRHCRGVRVDAVHSAEAREP